MSDFSIIDSFLQTFITYIDSGFGLLNGDVAGLASILIGIDVTLAALFFEPAINAGLFCPLWEIIRRSCGVP